MTTRVSTKPCQMSVDCPFHPVVFICTQLSFCLSTETRTQMKKGESRATTRREAEGRDSATSVVSVRRGTESSHSSPSFFTQSHCVACAPAVLVSSRVGSEGNVPRKSSSNQSPCDPSEVVNPRLSGGGGQRVREQDFREKTRYPTVMVTDQAQTESEIQVPATPLTS